MKSQTLIILGVIAALLVAGAFAATVFLKKGSGNETTGGSTDTLGEPAVTIVRTNEGYEPKEVTIQKGDIVSFINESDEYHWPASDLHPTHGIYPEFDPLKPIAPGDEWRFKFEQAGEWKYHDHIRANKVGTITVEE